MNTPLLSAYVSAWDLVLNGFDYQSSLDKMLAFFDEVTVAANTSKDDSLSLLQEWAAREPRLRVISTDCSYQDVTFDGAIKNAALQACSPGHVYVQMDLDEFVPLNQRDLWRQYAEILIDTLDVQCMMVPTLDVWGSIDRIRISQPLGTKFRMHKGGLKRGVWKEAWVIPGKRFRTDMSDSCELLDQNGNLARCARAVPDAYLNPAICSMLASYPFTVHTGYLNFEQRVRVNKAVWKDHWELRSGKRENVAVDPADLREVETIKHNLKLS